MRILHVIPSVSPIYGGPSVAVRAMAGALAARGHEVHIATTDAADDRGGRLDVPVSTARQEDDVTFRYFTRWPSTRWKYSWTLTKWLHREIGAFDVVHVHALFSYATIPACRFARGAGVPYILRPLGTLDAWSLNQRSWRKRPYLALVERRHIRQAAALHATSESEAAFLRALGGRRVEVIPLGVEPLHGLPEGRRVPTPGEPLRVLFLSRIHEKKGIPVLLEAARLVRTAGVPLTLTIAGAGDPAYESELRSQAEAMGIGDAVRWPGQVAGEAKRDLLATGDVFVLPSSQENFGIAVAEALAAGMPAVMSHAVAISAEVEAAGAGKALPIEARRFADALIDYARNPGARLAAGRSAAAFARSTYSWPACAARLEALYEGIRSGIAGRDDSRARPSEPVNA